MASKPRKRTWLHKGVIKEAWVFNYTDPNTGKRPLVTCATRKEADRERQRIEHEIQMGLHVAKRQTIIFGELLDLFLADRERQAKSKLITWGTFVLDRNYVEKRLKPAVGNIRLSDADYLRRQLQTLVDDAVAAGYSQVPGCLRHVAKIALQYAVDQDWLPRSPLTDRPLRSPPARNKISVPTREQARALIRVVEARQLGERASTHLTRKAIIYLPMFTGGMRRSEVAGLQWGDVDFINGVIEICHRFTRTDGLENRTKSKAGTRTVSMLPVLRDVLGEIWENSGRPKTGYVLRTETGAHVYETINAIFQRTMRWAGLLYDGSRTRPAFPYHSLRHCYAASMAAKRVPWLEISRSIGHAKASTTMDVYAYLYPDDDRVTPALHKIADDFMPRGEIEPIKRPMTRLEIDRAHRARKRALKALPPPPPGLDGRDKDAT
jgi:integrase